MPWTADSGQSTEDPRQRTIDAWMKGVNAPRHVAEGIADNVGRESSFRPTVSGDSGTSVGLYQAHNDRMTSLKEQPNWQDPDVQHKWAMSQVQGGDKIATEHWDEIKSAKTREQARDLFKKYFERPAATGWQVTESDKPGGRIDREAIIYAQSRPHQSVWYLDPKELLENLPPIEKDEAGETQGKSLAKSLGAGDPIYDIPEIEVSAEGGTRKISSYDGRHRLKAMVDAGLTAVPVVVKGLEPGVRPDALEGMTGKIMPIRFNPVPPPPRQTLPEALNERLPRQAPPNSFLGESGQALKDAARDIPRALGNIAQGLAGVGERAELAQQQAAGAPQREPAIPLTGGEEAAGLGDFTTGGLLNRVAPLVRDAQLVLGAPAASMGNAMRELTPEGRNMMAAAEAARAEPLISRGPPPMSRITPEVAQLGREALDRDIPITGPRTAEKQVEIERKLAQKISNTFGQNSPALTPQVLGPAKRRIGDRMNAIEQGHRMSFDQKLWSDMAKIEADAAKTLTSKGRFNVVKQGIKDVTVDHARTEAAKAAAKGGGTAPKEVLRGGLSGEQFADLVHEGGPIAALADHTKDDVARFGQKIEDALRDLMQRRLPPAEAAEYRELRHQYKNLKTVEPAVDQTGRVDFNKLDRSVGRKFPDRRADQRPTELMKLADIAKEFGNPPPAPAPIHPGMRVAEAMAGTFAGHLIGGPLGGAVGLALGVGGHEIGRNLMRSLTRPHLTEALIVRALREIPPPGYRRNQINALMSRYGASTLSTPISAGQRPSAPTGP